jgi:hypothetical protein
MDFSDQKSKLACGTWVYRAQYISQGFVRMFLV